MTASDLLAALVPVVDALDALGVRYFVGDSVASSAHGVPRASIDAQGAVSATWPTNATGSPLLTGGVPTTYSTLPAKGALTSASTLP